MKTFLYTWNPKNWDWYDLQGDIYRVNNNEFFHSYWSCGVTKRISIGDRFFILRLGVEPKGIIGCGYIYSEPYPLLHWDKEKAKKGITNLRTDIMFTALSTNPLIPLSYLQNKYPSSIWTPQASGTSIHPEIAEELFSYIQSNVNQVLETPTKNELLQFAEGKPKCVTYKTYERSSAAREACIRYHGYHCSVCGFNFGNIYGDLGLNYIEVHHLHPIADIHEEYLINPLEDLRPVCANCHRMLHITKPPISIEELKEIKNHIYGFIEKKPAS